MQKEFSIRFRGYDISQVDDFLEEAAREYNQVRGGKRAVLKEGALPCSRSLPNTGRMKRPYMTRLPPRRQIGSDMQENARKEASLIISGAQLDADKIIADVRQQCAVLQQEINSMVQKRAQFETSLRSLLENYLEHARRGTSQGENSLAMSNDKAQMSNECQSSNNKVLAFGFHLAFGF